MFKSAFNFEQVKIDEPIIFLKTVTRWFFSVFFSRQETHAAKMKVWNMMFFFQIKVTKGIELLLPPLQSDISPENGWVGQMICFFLSKKNGSIFWGRNSFILGGVAAGRLFHSFPLLWLLDQTSGGLRHLSLGAKVSSLHTDGCRVPGIW